MAGEWPPTFGARWRWLGYLRAMRRAVLLALWTLLAIPVQAVLLLLPGKAQVRFARLYWLVFRRTGGTGSPSNFNEASPPR